MVVIWQLQHCRVTIYIAWHAQSTIWSRLKLIIITAQISVYLLCVFFVVVIGVTVTWHQHEHCSSTSVDDQVLLRTLSSTLVWAGWKPAGWVSPWWWVSPCDSTETATVWALARGNQWGRTQQVKVIKYLLGLINYSTIFVVFVEAAGQKHQNVERKLQDGVNEQKVRLKSHIQRDECL